ncbi:MAG: CotS family spore coat protein [Firmicutes bacterium]|nr:CotS family spore coat protein [Bacillota bacterium]
MRDKTDLLQALGEWPITPKGISPYKDVYKVDAEEGIYCLKQVDKKTRRALALEGVLEHLVAEKFTLTAKPHHNNAGRLLSQIRPGVHYILTDWVQGRSPDFRKFDADIVGAAATLALFHNASCGYVPPPGGKLRSRLSRWPTRLISRLREVVRLREELNHKLFLDNFDRAFLQYYPWILDRAEQGLQIFTTPQYDDLVKTARRNNSFCHGDVAQRNFIVGDQGGYYIIDLDLVRRDTKAADLYKLFRDVTKKRRWDFTAAQLILQGYSKITPLKADELAVLYGFLCYPHKIIHLILRYYVKREGKSRGWSTSKFIEKLHELGKRHPMENALLQAFRSEYKIS